MSAPKFSNRCPCGGDAVLIDCCGRYHAGLAAPTAQALMRSRYSAYVLGRVDYLMASWHPDTRPANLDLSTENMRWLGLAIRREQRLDDDHATVEFIARYRVGGAPAVRLHEISRFVRVEGRWFYLDGEFPAP